MPRKNIALEISLIFCALIVAFITQALMKQTQPPKLPEFESTNHSSELSKQLANEADTIDQLDTKRDVVPESHDVNQSTLGTAPDWSILNRYQHTISRQEFLDSISKLYTVGPYWEKWFTVEKDKVIIRTHATDLSKIYSLSFKSEENFIRPEKYWRSKSELQLGDQSMPLAGLKLAIDPGHIGGEYAGIEQRRFIYREGIPPIQEGNLTLIVAELLTEQLETLGASVELVRDKDSPVNTLRSEDYYAYARSWLTSNKAAVTQKSVKRLADKLFYRNGEIRARANLINNQIKPDLVLCIHFNAAAEPTPTQPKLYPDEHFHIILNGAYTDDELANDDERFFCVLRMLQGMHKEEASLGAVAASHFYEETNLPAYAYMTDSSRAVNIGGNPFLWARNLIANRLYQCPVIYYEPYLMNGLDSFSRLQAGDYTGLKYVNGKLRPSIFREYVDAVTCGLVDYYTADDKLPHRDTQFIWEQATKKNQSGASEQKPQKEQAENIE